MSGDDHDDRVAGLFAGLTALLEDAAALAADGQQAGMPRVQGVTLAGEIGALIREAQGSLSEILRLLDA